MAFDKPQSRNEAILQNMLGANNELEPPKSRVEALLQDIAGQMPEANPSEGTTTGTLERLKIGDDIYSVEGGGSGTSDYDALNNKPQIAGVTLSGDKSLADLGIASASAVSGILDGTDIDSFGDVETALGDKVDKVNGKGLSTNDYDDTEKAAVTAATTAIAGIKDGTTIDSFGDVETALGAIQDGQSIDSFADVESAIGAIEDGTTIDSFADVESALADKQDATDSNLQTTADTIVGAINEHEGDIGSLKSGLTTLSDEVNGDATTYDFADVITIENAVPANLADCSVKVEPVQDLHGYDKPWVGGAGKNKLPMTVDGIKAANIAGTWSGNAYTVKGVTFTVNTDNDGNVTEIKATGTANSGVDFSLFTSANFDASSLNGMKLNGITGGSSGTYMFRISDVTTGSFTAINGDNTISSLSNTGKVNFIIGISSGYAIPTDGLTFYPMIRLSTEQDATFAPYTNICPITGRTEASVQRDGKNLVDLANVTGTSGTVYGATKLLPAGTYYGYFFGEYQAWNHFYQYSLDGVNYTNIPTTDDGYAVADVSSGTYYHEKNKLIIHQPAYIRLGIQKNSYVGDNSVDALLTVDSTYYNEINDFTKTGIYYQKMYEPYAGKTYTIALGDTIYGGTVDFNTGVMKVDSGTLVVDENTQNMTLHNTGDSTAVFKIVTGQECVNDGRQKSNISTHDTNGWNSDIAKPCFVMGQEGNLYIQVPLTVASTLSDFRTWLASNNVQIFYPLKDADITTIQLTPQQIQLLKGTNTLYASTGDISVTVNGVSGSIGGLTEDVANIVDAIGWDNHTNLLGGEVLTGWYNDNGEIQPSESGTGHTKLEKAKPSTKYSMSIYAPTAAGLGANGKYGFYFWDANGNFISRSVRDFTATTYSAVSPSNCAYISFQITAEGSTAAVQIGFDMSKSIVVEGDYDGVYKPYHPVIGTAVEELLDKVPDAPSTDGTYSLQVTVASGVPTYSWVIGS